MVGAPNREPGEPLRRASRTWAVLRATFLPDSGADADTRAAFTREERASTARNLRYVLPMMLLIHIASVALFPRLEVPTETHASWLRWVIGLHAALGVGAAIGAVGTWTRWRASAGRAGDAITFLYILGPAMMSANVQRLHPNFHAFLLGVFCVGFLFHPLPRVFFGAFALGAAAVAAGGAYFRTDVGQRAADLAALVVLGSIGALGFLLTRAARFRELVSRRQVEQLNAQLEDRVQEQVHEIVARAEEIEHLNTQLNEKVRERSRELSTALARLAEGHAPIPRGTILGDRVEIESLIAHGGMGAVYRARDLVTNRTVAVKVVQAGSVNELESLHRFLREARVMATLTHPGIVRPLHVDVSNDGRLFQVMELVQGQTLQRVLDLKGTLPEPIVARLGAVLADGLAAAHTAGIVHRDVKPANVMLTSAPPGMKLLDFGISRVREAGADDPALTEGQVIGTPQFLSPEQVNDPAAVNEAADIYSLGLVLYLCLSGHLPFKADSAQTWLLVHALQEPVDLRRRAPGVGERMATLVMSCLEKVPRDRPTAREIAASLGEIAEAESALPLEMLGLDAPSGSDLGKPDDTTAAGSGEPTPITIIQPTHEQATPARQTLKAAK